MTDKPVSERPPIIHAPACPGVRRDGTETLLASGSDAIVVRLTCNDCGHTTVHRIRHVTKTIPARPAGAVKPITDYEPYRG